MLTDELQRWFETAQAVLQQSFATAGKVLQLCYEAVERVPSLEAMSEVVSLLVKAVNERAISLFYAIARCYEVLKAAVEVFASVVERLIAWCYDAALRCTDLALAVKWWWSDAVETVSWWWSGFTWWSPGGGGEQGLWED
ncbi:hypothetical protein LSAT2_001735 [Lamellibrachia satsuma]|nr:hypothetical protein LSAT2_001735 [Lamellibrachia satsuma]